MYTPFSSFVYTMTSFFTAAIPGPQCQAVSVTVRHCRDTVHVQCTEPEHRPLAGLAPRDGARPLPWNSPGTLCAPRDGRPLTAAAHHQSARARPPCAGGAVAVAVAVWPCTPSLPGRKWPDAVHRPTPPGMSMDASMARLNPESEWKPLWRALSQLGWRVEQPRRSSKTQWYVPPMANRFETVRVERKAYYEDEAAVRAYLTELKTETNAAAAAKQATKDSKRPGRLGEESSSTNGSSEQQVPYETAELLAIRCDGDDGAPFWIGVVQEQRRAASRGLRVQWMQVCRPHPHRCTVVLWPNL